ncbi:unnamed protein product [Camellia sinensis]
MSIARVALSPIYEESLNFPGHVSGQHDPWSRESIWIYLTVAGSVIPMRILESDSIASVKLRIQNYKGFFVKKQKLVFEGKELSRNNSCVRDYGVTEGNVLHLILRFSDLQAIIVRTVCGKEFKFQVERTRNVGYVKNQIAKKGKGFGDLKDQELICNGEELEDQRLIDEICKKDDAVIHLVFRKSAKVSARPVEKDFEISIEALDLNERGTNVVDGGQDEYGTQSKQLEVVAGKPLQGDFLLEPLIVNPKIELPLVIKKLINSTFDGLESGNQPIRSSEGSGGAYFMQDAFGQEYISVFKPIDEEPMAVNNPRGLPLSIDGEGLKKGTRVGEGALREVAAYLLDHPRSGPHLLKDTGFAGVPPTVMVKCLYRGFNFPEGYEYASKNIKIGSLQMFMKNCGSCEDMGPRAFPVDEVHKISVLDIRLANADRHAGNILVQRDSDGQIVLIPIDHGYCLPENRGTNVVDGGQDECGTQSKQLEGVAGKPLQGDFLLEPLIVNPKIELPLVIKKLINSTFDGLESGNQPIRSSEGSGDGEGLKKGTRVGEGALREVAAYLLDHPRSGPHLLKDTGFAGVPPTVMVIKCLYRGFNFPEGSEYASKNIKIGSLQMFMKNCGSCEDMGPRAFPVDEVHKISVLDIRLANADRHAGNILVQRYSDGQIVLIPIDHGYCLPENFEDCTFDWLYWPQAHQPYSPDTIDYIRSLDADRDIELLKFYGWDLPLECARTLRISTMLLKKGAERGLTPFAIGSIMCRETLKKESVIEQIVQEAQEAVLPGTSEAAYLESVLLIMDRRLDELSP